MGVVPGPAPWMVKIVDERGALCGSGLLVTADTVLTCAHVVGEAETWFVEFVDQPGGRRVPARVRPDAFFAPSAGQRGDIALLALDEPRPGRETASLRRFPVGRVERFRAYAFPHDDAIGVWALATLVGKAGPGGEWIQLHRAGGVPVRPGFSGAGVLADPYGHLVGMMVAAHPAEDQAFMIPAGTIDTYLPDVPWITGPRAIAEDLTPQASGEPDGATMREVSEFVGGPPGANIRVVVAPRDTPRSTALHRAVLAGDRYTGGVDLVVRCAGLSTKEIAARIAERAGVDARRLHRGQAPPMMIVLIGVDHAVDPGDVLREVVQPLGRRDNNRVLLAFDEEHSAALPLARELEKESSSRHARSGGGDAQAARAAVARARLAERTARSLHRQARLRLSDVPAGPAASRALRAELEAATTPEAFARLRAAGTAAEKQALGVRDRLAGLLAEHDRLRGLLSSYQQLSAQYGHAEDPVLTPLYRRAHALLHDGPADLAAAETAVDEFAAAVRACRP